MSFKELCSLDLKRSRFYIEAAYGFANHLDQNHMVLVNQSAQMFVMWHNDEETIYRITRIGDVSILDTAALMHRFQNAYDDAVFEFNSSEFEGCFKACLDANEQKFQLEQMFPNMGTLIYRTRGRTMKSGYEVIVVREEREAASTKAEQPTVSRMELTEHHADFAGLSFASRDVEVTSEVMNAAIHDGSVEIMDRFVSNKEFTTKRFSLSGYNTLEAYAEQFLYCAEYEALNPLSDVLYSPEIAESIASVRVVVGNTLFLLRAYGEGGGTFETSKFVIMFDPKLERYSTEVANAIEAYRKDGYAVFRIIPAYGE